MRSNSARITGSLLIAWAAALLGACSTPKPQGGGSGQQNRSDQASSPRRPGELQPLAGSGQMPEVTRGGMELAAAGQEVTLLVRDLKLHLRPGGQTYFSYSANPWDLSDPCGTALCYTTLSTQLTNHGQIGNCWVTSGPPVNVVTIRSAKLCSQ